MTTSLYQPSRIELAELLDGYPRYRVDQIWQGLYQNLSTPSEMTNLPKALRTTLTERPLPVNLAVSLHAANDQLRDELVPINKRYPIDDLMTACAEYLAAKGRRLSFEWAMIDGVNDRSSDAAELAALCRRFRLRAHVNLIPLNPTPGYPTIGSPLKRVHDFRDTLESLGVNATVRRNRGTDIDAACGQLAAGQPVTISRSR